MEAFHFPVGLGSIRSGAFVDSADLTEGVSERAGAAIRQRVVGHDPVDTESQRGEPVRGSNHEPGAGLAVPSVEDFGVGHPGVVIDY